MAMRDLNPWTRSRDIMTDFWRDEKTNPFFTLHREMNRFMDEVLRTFVSSPITPRMDYLSTAWPRVEVSDGKANHNFRGNARHRGEGRRAFAA